MWSAHHTWTHIHLWLPPYLLMQTLSSHRCLRFESNTTVNFLFLSLLFLNLVRTLALIIQNIFSIHSWGVCGGGGGGGGGMVIAVIIVGVAWISKPCAVGNKLTNWIQYFCSCPFSFRCTLNSENNSPELLSSFLPHPFLCGCVFHL